MDQINITQNSLQFEKEIHEPFAFLVLPVTLFACPLAGYYHLFHSLESMVNIQIGETQYSLSRDRPVSQSHHATFFFSELLGQACDSRHFSHGNITPGLVSVFS